MYVATQLNAKWIMVNCVNVPLATELPTGIYYCNFLLFATSPRTNIVNGYFSTALETIQDKEI